MGIPAPFTKDGNVNLFAGQTFAVHFRIKDGSGGFINLTPRVFAMAAYAADGTELAVVEATADSSTVVLAFDGTQTSGFLPAAKAQTCRVMIAERTAGGIVPYTDGMLRVQVAPDILEADPSPSLTGPYLVVQADGPSGNVEVEAFGAPGVPNQITIGSVTASAPGGNPQVTASGNAPNQTFDFVLPRGATGPQGLVGPTGDVTPEALAAKVAAETAEANAEAAAAAAAASAAIATTGSSPYVSALRLGRDATSGNVDVVATSTFFEQPIAEIGPSERWRGVVRANGLHFHVPYDATTVLVHNPDTWEMRRYTAADLGLPATAFSGTQKWNRAVVGRDGRIYCVPFDATSILVIDPFAMTASLETFGLPASALSGGDKWDGGALGSDGLIYCAPYAAVTMLVIDPANQSARVLTATQVGLASNALNGSAKYSGGVSVGNRVYFIPFIENDVMVVDVTTGTATQPTYGLTLTDTTKWSGAVVYGTSIYCAPFTATDILVIDTVAQTAVRTAMGASLTGGSKWRGLARVGSKIYGIPHASPDFLVIDPLVTTGSPQGTASRTNFNAYDVRTPTTQGNLVGSVKWAGGLAYKGIVYGCPSGSVQAGQDILVLDPAANGGVGQAYHTDGRALTSQNLATKWFGGVQHPNGYAYCIPATATDFLIIKDDDPTNDNPTAFRSTLGLTLNTENQKFQGGGLLGDNCIYAMPRSGETNMLKIDPSNTSASPFGTATLFGANTAVDLDNGTTGNSLAVLASPYVLGGVDSQAYHSCVVGMDGKLYGVPYRSEKVLIFNYKGTPGSLSNPQLALTNFGLDLTGADKWVGGCLHPNGKIYCGPRSRNTCLVIDTNPLSVTYGQAWLTSFGVNLDTGSGLSGAANLAMKWSYPKVGADGRIYIAPRKAANFLVINPADTSLDPHGRATFEAFGLNLSSFAAIDGYSIANKMGTDGKLYVAALEGLGPAGTGPFLVVDTIARTASWQTFGLPTSGANSINTGNKVAGAIHTLAGAIIFVPRSGQPAIRIRPKCQPLPPAAIFHPAMFAN